MLQACADSEGDVSSALGRAERDSPRSGPKGRRGRWERAPPAGQSRRRSSLAVTPRTFSRLKFTQIGSGLSLDVSLHGGFRNTGSS